MTEAARIALVVLTGDTEHARAEIEARFPGASVEVVEKSGLRGGAAAALARLRAWRPDRFVYFTRENAWQLGRFKLLAFAVLAGARRVTLMDLAGHVEELSRSRVLLLEAPRAALGLALSIPLVLASVLASFVLGTIARRRRFRGAGKSPDEPLDILFLRPTPATGIVEGGESSHILGVLSGLRALGHRVRVLSNSRLPAVERAGYDVAAREPGRLFASFQLPFELWNNVVLAARAWREVRRRQPDFVYERHSRNAWPGVVAARLAGVPLVLEWNGSEAWVGRHWYGLRWAWLIDVFERVNVRGADTLVVVSSALARGLEAAGVEAARIVVNPNGADPARFRPGAGGDRARTAHGLGEAPVVGFVGAFNYYQGAPVLMSAAPEVCRRCEARFLVVGSGDALVETRSTVVEGGVQSRVIFTGHVPVEDVPAYVDAFDVAVAPLVQHAGGGEFFNSPVKLFEYMAAGRAIVASRLGQMAEVIEDGVTGLLVEPGDAGALAEAIVRLVEDRDLRERLGRAARQVAVERYTWRTNAERVVRAYLTLEHSTGSGSDRFYRER